MDINAREVLEDALSAFPGTVLVVSHDRYFLSQVATTIFEVKDKVVTEFDCDYYDYLLKTEPSQGVLQLSRQVSGDKHRISHAKEVVFNDAQPPKTKNFGGSGIKSGDPFKGVKNAKRYGS